MTKPKSPLVELTFTDNRPGNEQTIDLCFVPVAKELFERHRQLWIETNDFFGNTYSPLCTVSQLFERWLESELKDKHVDRELLEACFRLINFLDTIHTQSDLVGWYTDEAKKAVAYVEREVSRD